MLAGGVWTVQSCADACFFLRVAHIALPPPPLTNTFDSQHDPIWVECVPPAALSSRLRSLSISGQRQCVAICPVRPHVLCHHHRSFIFRFSQNPTRKHIPICVKFAFPPHTRATCCSMPCCVECDGVLQRWPQSCSTRNRCMWLVVDPPHVTACVACASCTHLFVSWANGMLAHSLCPTLGIARTAC
jgi:hypothetical protein